MKIKQLFNSGRPLRSFEVFPPKRDGELEPLFQAIAAVKALKPDFISVTYGAGGSNRGMAFEVASRLKRAGVEPLVHLTCVGHSSRQVAEVLDQLAAAGIENILALRGDPPKGEAAFTQAPGGFKNAGELVRFIRSRWGFCVGVAGYPETHPEAASAQADMDALKWKVEGGADFVTTQLFFDNALYFDYARRARAAGVQVPIIPGVMPVFDVKGLARYASFGTRVPEALRQQVMACGEAPGAAAAPGLAWAVEQCRGLLQGGAPGIHLYMMNKAATALALYQALG
jgi:methylenetetrahydrofolate reductase (NADPH)